jgi:hypothetical protein
MELSMKKESAWQFFKNIRGQIVIPAKYDDVYGFRKSLAAVEVS